MPSIPRTVVAALCAVSATLLAACAHYEIVGYQAGWKPFADFAPHDLTVVNYAFADISTDGSIVLEHPTKERAALARLAAMKRRNPDLELMVSVGGWTRSNGFSAMAADASMRKAFTASSVEFLRQHRFDGLDIDWEYPGDIGDRCPADQTCQRVEDKRNFVRLARELRAAFDAAGATDGKHYLLTIAAGTDDKYLRDADGSTAWLADLARSLDWINLMTYDFHGSWERVAGFNAPLGRDPADPANANVESSVARLMEAGIPARKITLGMPFYGKGWSGCSAGENQGLYQPCTGLAAGSSEETFEFAYLTDQGYLVRDEEGQYTYAGRGFTRRWNDAARVPYLFNPATGEFITYDDERSIAEKVSLVKRLGLRGAMFWELDADRHGVLRGVVSGGLPH